MSIPEAALNFHEKVSFSLRSLYRRQGYAQYKMNKFEEYDLYARNKDFLISDSVITFMDTNGKLMALKPDMTLSIVKNSKDDVSGVQKLYYHENVYRVAKGSHSFKEIMQVGLECIGLIDDYCISEVLSLAAQSLLTISHDCVLNVSHLGLLSRVIDAVGIPAEQKSAVFKAIGGKNAHELEQLCRENAVTDNGIHILKQLLAISGKPEAVLPTLEQLLSGFDCGNVLVQLQSIVSALSEAQREILRIDFSVVDDIHYYNGIVFKGFIQGLPGSVLSGGQYDNLLRRLKRSAGAIGFAVYLDMLERLESNRREYDVDTLLLYTENTPPAALRARAEALTASGGSVMVQRTVPEGLRYRQLMKMNGSEVALLENNA